MATKSRNCNYRKTMHNEDLAAQVSGLGGTLAGVPDEEAPYAPPPCLMREPERPSVTGQK